MNRIVVLSEEELRALLREELQRALAMQNGDTLLTTTEAAKLLGVTRRTITIYVQRKYLKNHGIGRNIKLKRSEVLELKASGNSHAGRRP